MDGSDAKKTPLHVQSVNDSAHKQSYAANIEASKDSSISLFQAQQINESSTRSFAVDEEEDLLIFANGVKMTMKSNSRQNCFSITHDEVASFKTKLAAYLYKMLKNQDCGVVDEVVYSLQLTEHLCNILDWLRKREENCSLYGSQASIKSAVSNENCFLLSNLIIAAVDRALINSNHWSVQSLEKQATLLESMLTQYHNCMSSILESSSSSISRHLFCDAICWCCHLLQIMTSKLTLDDEDANLKVTLRLVSLLQTLSVCISTCRQLCEPAAREISEVFWIGCEMLLKIACTLCRINFEKDAGDPQHRLRLQSVRSSVTSRIRRAMLSTVPTPQEMFMVIASVKNAYVREKTGSVSYWPDSVGSEDRVNGAIVTFDYAHQSTFDEAFPESGKGSGEFAEQERVRHIMLGLKSWLRVSDVAITCATTQHGTLGSGSVVGQGNGWSKDGPISDWIACLAEALFLLLPLLNNFRSKPVVISTEDDRTELVDGVTAASSSASIARMELFLAQLAPELAELLLLTVSLGNSILPKHDWIFWELTKRLSSFTESSRARQLNRKRSLAGQLSRLSCHSGVSSSRSFGSGPAGLAPGPGHGPSVHAHMERVILSPLVVSQGMNMADEGRSSPDDSPDQRHYKNAADTTVSGAKEAKEALAMGQPSRGSKEACGYAATSSASDEPKFAVGDGVDGSVILPNGSQRWFPGTIAAVNGNGTYHIKYKDGDEDLKKKGMEIRVSRRRQPKGKPHAPDSQAINAIDQSGTISSDSLLVNPLALATSIDGPSSGAERSASAAFDPAFESRSELDLSLSTNLDATTVSSHKSLAIEVPSALATPSNSGRANEAVPPMSSSLSPVIHASSSHFKSLSNGVVQKLLSPDFMLSPMGPGDLFACGSSVGRAKAGSGEQLEQRLLQEAYADPAGVMWSADPLISTPIAKSSEYSPRFLGHVTDSNSSSRRQERMDSEQWTDSMASPSRPFSGLQSDRRGSEPTTTEQTKSDREGSDQPLVTQLANAFRPPSDLGLSINLTYGSYSQIEGLKSARSEGSCCSEDSGEHFFEIPSVFGVTRKASENVVPSIGKLNFAGVALHSASNQSLSSSLLCEVGEGDFAGKGGGSHRDMLFDQSQQLLSGRAMESGRFIDMDATGVALGSARAMYAMGYNMPSSRSRDDVNSSGATRILSWRDDASRLTARAVLTGRSTARGGVPRPLSQPGEAHIAASAEVQSLRIKSAQGLHLHLLHNAAPALSPSSRQGSLSALGGQKPSSARIQFFNDGETVYDDIMCDDFGYELLSKTFGIVAAVLMRRSIFKEHFLDAACYATRMLMQPGMMPGGGGGGGGGGGYSSHPVSRQNTGRPLSSQSSILSSDVLMSARQMSAASQQQLQAPAKYINLLFNVREYLDAVADRATQAAFENLGFALGSSLGPAANRISKLLSPFSFSASCLPSHLDSATKIGSGGFGSIYRFDCPQSCSGLASRMARLSLFEAADNSEWINTPSTKETESKSNTATAKTCDLKRCLWLNCGCIEGLHKPIEPDDRATAIGVSAETVADDAVSPGDESKLYSYAVKRIPRERSAHDPSTLRAIYDEISALESLALVRGVCRLIDYGAQGSEYWIVMELGGPNLCEWRRRNMDSGGWSPIQRLMVPGAGGSGAAAFASGDFSGFTTIAASMQNWSAALNRDESGRKDQLNDANAPGAFSSAVLSRAEVAMCLRLFLDSVLIVKAVHEADVVHFDLKATNFVIKSSPAMKGQAPTAAMPNSIPAVSPHPLRRSLLAMVAVDLGQMNRCHAQGIASGQVTLLDFGEAVPHFSTLGPSAATDRCRGTLAIQAPEMLRLSSPTARTPSSSAVPSNSEIRASAATSTASINQKSRPVGPGPASDVWSLGCLLVELITGDTLFAGREWADLFVNLCVEKGAQQGGLQPGSAVCPAVAVALSPLRLSLSELPPSIALRIEEVAMSTLKLAPGDRPHLLETVAVIKDILADRYFEDGIGNDPEHTPTKHLSPTTVDHSSANSIENLDDEAFVLRTFREVQTEFVESQVEHSIGFTEDVFLRFEQLHPTNSNKTVANRFSSTTTDNQIGKLKYQTSFAEAATRSAAPQFGTSKQPQQSKQHSNNALKTSNVSSRVPTVPSLPLRQQQQQQQLNGEHFPLDTITTDSWQQQQQQQHAEKSAMSARVATRFLYAHESGLAGAVRELGARRLHTSTTVRKSQRIVIGFDEDCLNRFSSASTELTTDAVVLCTARIEDVLTQASRAFRIAREALRSGSVIVISIFPIVNSSSAILLHGCTGADLQMGFDDDNDAATMTQRSNQEDFSQQKYSKFAISVAIAFIETLFQDVRRQLGTRTRRSCDLLKATEPLCFSRVVGVLVRHLLKLK